MGVSALDHVLRHNTWATGALIDFCRQQGPATLDARAPGTYGTVQGTLQHVVRAEQWYVQLLTGERIARGGHGTLAQLSEISASIGARVLTVAATDDASRIIMVNEGRSSTVGVIIAQLVHHGNEHRTQVTTILGACGIEPPAVSAWGYGRAAGISEAEE